jgi:catechol 2,3-dioxygenase-like lactoylglutathione lyase family enzyme
VPVIHLVEAADKGSAWGGPAGAAGKDTGPFDHVAFHGTDFDAMRARLVDSGMEFRERVVPGGALKQLFVPDPEGVLVEINFRT